MPTPKEGVLVEFGECWPPKNPHAFKYSIVPGCFIQSDETTDSTIFDFREKDLGLVVKTPEGTPDWATFAAKIEQLNDDAPEGVAYKVLYLGRHGEGPHNVAIQKYGMPAWDTKWARLSKDDVMTWGPDPDLTPLGREEAAKANAAWKDQISKYKILKSGAMPQHFYSSPFTRAASTLLITWGDIVLNLPNPPRPLVCEKFRETIGWHTCDKRGLRSHTEKMFPMYDIEQGFTEEDEHWKSDLRESPAFRNERLRGALDELFLEDGATWISITAHSGCIQSIVAATGHRKFYLQTGGMIPIVVRAELIDKSMKLPERLKGIPYGPFHDIEEKC